jgi:hypothetical protein
MNNMTPKDKAKEMYIKFDFVYVQNYTSKFEVKRCALIAVDEILDALPDTTSPYNLKQIDYWQQVKQEIDKL